MFIDAPPKGGGTDCRSIRPEKEVTPPKSGNKGSAARWHDAWITRRRLCTCVRIPSALLLSASALVLVSCMGADGKSPAATAAASPPASATPTPAPTATTIPAFCAPAFAKMQGKAGDGTTTLTGWNTWGGTDICSTMALQNAVIANGRLQATLVVAHESSLTASDYPAEAHNINVETGEEFSFRTLSSEAIAKFAFDDSGNITEVSAKAYVNGYGLITGDFVINKIAELTTTQ